MTSRRTAKPMLNMFLAALLATGGLLSVFTTAYAQGIVYGSSVPAGVTIQNDIILFGDDVVIDGTVDGDVIALGNTVHVNGAISGALVTAAQSVTVKGKVGGSAYIASLVLAFGPAAQAARSVYFVGGQLDTATGSAIARDINAIALGAHLEGELGRNMRSAIGPVDLLRLAVQGINSLLGANRIQLPPLLAPTSAIPDTRGLQLTVSSVDGLLSMGIASPAQGLPPSTAIDTDRLLAWLLRFGLDLVTFVVLGLLLVLLAPGMLSRGAHQLRTSPWAALGWGVAVFATGIVALILALAVVLALSMLFWALSLGALGSLTFAVGLFSVLLAAVLYVFLVLFCSKLVAAFFVGQLILGAISPRAADTKAWSMLLGILVYLLLAAIPYFGWLVAVSATFFGLGAIWMSVRDTGRL
ncbi:MAG: polymer-forming cytoskeletal protein [Chloroflexi bacterium]|nr:polymer-forming cytoskeletal protein [Chloroflexota bacterium]